MAVNRADVTDGDGLVRFFERCESRCYCRYWHFEGDKNDWLDRCANRPVENRAQALRSLGAPKGATAVIARVTGANEIVGWSQLAFASDVPKVVEQRYYRNLPCLQDGRSEMMVVLCMLVHPAHRRHGIGLALARGAIEEARSRGAKMLVALPRVSLERVSDEELWLGPHSAYARLGFEEVHRERPYPVLMLNLAQSASPAVVAR